MLVVAVEKRLGDFTLAVRFEATAGATALFGPSGAGKSSVANLIAGLIAPDRGRIALDDTVLFDSASRIDVPPHLRRIGYVFQEGRLFPHLTVRRNLDYGRYMNGLPRAADEMARVVDLLDIGPLLARRPGKLSGGERQRVAIARAIVNAPSVLLADEPTGNLDSANAAAVADLLFDLQRDTGMTLVLVTHDESLAARCRRCVRVRDGEIAEDRIQLPARAPREIEAAE